MTEGQWITCTEPVKMLAFLREAGVGGERKQRLFAAACCRRVWGLLDQIGNQAVEVAEQSADGTASVEELVRSENLAWWGADGLNYEDDTIRDAGWAARCNRR